MLTKLEREKIGTDSFTQRSNDFASRQQTNAIDSKRELQLSFVQTTQYRMNRPSAWSIIPFPRARSANTWMPRGVKARKKGIPEH